MLSALLPILLFGVMLGGYEDEDLVFRSGAQRSRIWLQSALHAGSEVAV
jgi:hypothetical protein